MTKIECKRCGDIFETTKRKITLPFYCPACNESKMFLDAMKPKSEAAQYADCVPDAYPDASSDAYPEVSCGCDSASVEATTELIANLERDLASIKLQYDEAVDTLARVVVAEGAAEEQIVFLEERLDEAKKENVALEMKLVETETMLEEAEDSVRDHCSWYVEMREKNDRLKSRGFWARVFNKN